MTPHESIAQRFSSRLRILIVMMTLAGMVALTVAWALSGMPEDEPPLPLNMQATAMPSATTPSKSGLNRKLADVPKRLQRLKDLRDNRLKSAHLKFAGEARSYLSAISAYENDINQTAVRFAQWAKLAPILAGLDHQQPEPPPIDRAKHESQIDAAASKVVQAKTEYEISVDTILADYEREINALLTGDAEADVFDVPKTEFVEDIEFAMFIEPDRQRHILKAQFVDRINLLRGMSPNADKIHAYPSTFAQMRWSFRIQLGEHPNATPERKDLAKALLLCDQCVVAIVSLRESPDAHAIQNEIDTLNDQLMRARFLLIERNYREANPILAEIAALLPGLGTKSTQRVKRQVAQRSFESVRAALTDDLLKRYGGDSWVTVQKILADLSKEKDDLAIAGLYQRAAEILNKNTSAIRMAAVKDYEQQARWVDAIVLLERQLSADPNDKSASSAYNYLIRSRPIGILQLAEKEIVGSHNWRDQALAWSLVARGWKAINEPTMADLAAKYAAESMSKADASDSRTVFIHGMVASQLRSVSSSALTNYLHATLKLVNRSERAMAFDGAVMAYLRGIALRVGDESSAANLADALLRRTQSWRNDPRSDRNAWNTHFEILTLAGKGEVATAITSAKQLNMRETWGGLLWLSLYSDEVYAERRQFIQGLRSCRNPDQGTFDFGSPFTNTKSGFFEWLYAESTGETRYRNEYTASIQASIYDAGYRRKESEGALTLARGRSIRMEEDGLEVVGELLRTEASVRQATTITPAIRQACVRHSSGAIRAARLGGLVLGVATPSAAKP